MAKLATQGAIEAASILAKEAKKIGDLRMAGSILLPALHRLTLQETARCLGIAGSTVS